MDLAKKLANIFSVIFLAVFLVSCGSGCVESDEFDKESISVEANPKNDGIDGVGEAQVAMWHDTGLMTNGEKIVVQITGGWSPWYGNADLSSENAIKGLPACTFCFKNNLSNNCICASGQVPTSESSYAGSDCATNLTAQNDITKCTCTTQYGSITDYGVYSFTLNKYDKYHNDLNPDQQTACKYTGGMGLYMGLFGTSGSVTPLRVYHAFSQYSVCDVDLDSQGRCLDDGGNDITKYIFASANEKTFMKDDNAGNDGVDNNSADDVYHSNNEVLKMIIHDSRYDDNYGSYKISFLSGVGLPHDLGMLEFLVKLMEDKIMGVPDSDGIRQGGVIQAMFNQITQNYGFIQILQVSLSIYITFYGVAVLLGLADVNKKELMNRVTKIALVIFFTSKASWQFYDQIVVGFFKDSMDYLIGMLTSISDQNIDQTSGLITSQMERVAANSNSTRFAYVDSIIKKLLSDASTRKIMGLFFGTPIFGILYILIIYLLIAAFIGVMLLVASIYIIAMIKIAFVLALGPIFIAFTLSSHTNEMFKKWLSFLGARSLEIIFLFLVLYNFLVLIDKSFTSMLSYKTCVSQFGIARAVIPILKAEVSRSLFDWFGYFIKIGALIFIMYLIIEKVADLAGSLITIGGVANKDDDGAFGKGGFTFGQSLVTGGETGAGNTIGIMGAATMLRDEAHKYGAPIAAGAMNMTTNAVRAGAGYVGSKITGALGQTTKGRQFLNAAGKVSSMMPSGPGAMYRNSIVDSAIKDQEKIAKDKGLTGADVDRFVRQGVMNELLHNKNSKYTNAANSPLKSSFLMSMDATSIQQRLEQKLVNEKLASFVKDKSAELKGEGLIGRAMQERMGQEINKWADSNLAGGRESVQGILNNKGTVVDGIGWHGVGFRNMSELIRSQTEYSASEAAKAFKNNPEKQAEYLAHLEENKTRAQMERKETTDNAFSKTFNNISNTVQDGLGSAFRAVNPFNDLGAKDSIHNVAGARSEFLRQTSNKENLRTDNIANTMIDFARGSTGSWLKHNQGSILNPFNLLKNKDAIKQEVREGERQGILSYLRGSGSEREQESVVSGLKRAESNQQSLSDRNKAQEKTLKTEREFEDRRKFAKENLKENALKSALKGSEKISKDLKEISDLNKKSWDKFGQQIANRMNPFISTEQREKANKELEDKKKEDLKKVSDKKNEGRSLKSTLDELEQMKKDSAWKRAGSVANEGTAALSGRNIEAERKAMEEKTTALTQKIGQQLRSEYEDASKADKNLRQEIFGSENDRVFNQIDQMRKQGATISELVAFAKQETGSLTEDKQKKLQSVGGLLLMSEGLADVDGKTLFEAKARLDYFNARFGTPNDKNIVGGDGVDRNAIGTSSSPVSNVVSGGDTNNLIITASGNDQRSEDAHDKKTAKPSSDALSDIGSPDRSVAQSRDLFSEDINKIRKENFESLAGLGDSATARDAKMAYIKLSLKYHPDKVDAELKKQATEIFQVVNLSYEKYKDKKEKLSGESSRSKDSSDIYSSSKDSSDDGDRTNNKEAPKLAIDFLPNADKPNQASGILTPKEMDQELLAEKLAQARAEVEAMEKKISSQLSSVVASPNSAKSQNILDHLDIDFADLFKTEGMIKDLMKEVEKRLKEDAAATASKDDLSNFFAEQEANRLRAKQNYEEWLKQISNLSPTSETPSKARETSSKSSADNSAESLRSDNVQNSRSSEIPSSFSPSADTSSSSSNNSGSNNS